MFEIKIERTMYANTSENTSNNAYTFLNVYAMMEAFNDFVEWEINNCNAYDTNTYVSRSAYITVYCNECYCGMVEIQSENGVLLGYTNSVDFYEIVTNGVL